MFLLNSNHRKQTLDYKFHQFLCVLSLLFFIGCDEDNLVSVAEPDETVVGFTAVPLDASKRVVRGEEAVLGNLIADMLVSHANAHGHDVDFALVNGGAIRFDSESRPDGIFPPGNLTRDDLSEILPFGNTAVVIEMSGSELKSTLERAYFALPIPDDDSGSGTFLQISSSLQIVIDLALQPQVLDELAEPQVISVSGQRLVSIRVAGSDYESDAVYRVVVPDFIAEGGDGFVALRDIPEAKQVEIGINLADALAEYLTENVPVLPVLEGRITFQ